jgi:hypothetical protein
MRRSETAFDKIKWCLQDVDDFKDLIQINDTEEELAKRYSLTQTIAGNKIKNRVENLLVSCWSAKDYLKKDIIREIGEDAGKVFEKNLFAHEETDLVQYLADAIKHGGIDERYLKQNRFKGTEPKLEKTVLSLSNQSVPGPMKPTYRSEGDDVPGFEIGMVQCIIEGEIHYNFDTILLSIKITDNNNQYIGDAISLVFKFTNYLKREYNRIMRV